MRLTALGRSLPLKPPVMSSRPNGLPESVRTAATPSLLSNSDCSRKKAIISSRERWGPRSKTEAPPTGPNGLSRSSIGISWAGGRTITTAPLSLPLYWASSSAVAALSATTSACTLPSVPGIQPHEATVRGTSSSGSSIRSEAVPRFQASGSSHASWWTLPRP